MNRILLAAVTIIMIISLITLLKNDSDHKVDLLKEPFQFLLPICFILMLGFVLLFLMLAEGGFKFMV